MNIVSGRTSRKSILFQQSAAFPDMLLLFSDSFLLTSKYRHFSVFCSVCVLQHHIFRADLISEAISILCLRLKSWLVRDQGRTVEIPPVNCVYIVIFFL